MTDQEKINKNEKLLVYSVILIEFLAIIILLIMWRRDVASLELPKEHFGKEYQQKQDSADNVLKDKDSDIKRFDDKRTIRDSIRWIDRPKEKKQHEEINNLIDSTRIIWWKDLFRANGVH